MSCADFVEIRDCQALKDAIIFIMFKNISLSPTARWHRFDFVRSYFSTYCQPDKVIYRLYAFMTQRHDFTLSCTATDAKYYEVV